MNRPLLACAALCAMALAAAAPAMADRWYAPGTGSAYVPWGVAPQAPPVQVDRHGRPIIVTNGPIVVLPREPVPRNSFGHGAGDGYVPLRCLKSYYTNNGTLRLFEAECLQDRGIAPSQLPTRCAVSIRTTRDVLRGYDPSCLRIAGYRLAGD